MTATLRKIAFAERDKEALGALVTLVHEECPAQIQSRYLARLAVHRARLPQGLGSLFWELQKPLLLTNLPSFPDVERSKILALAIGEVIGRCVGYSEYNQSYITDVRPTTLSNEASSGMELLTMHNDLTFASDLCRPAALVLVAHTAEGDLPKTLLASVSDIEGLLTDDERAILREEVFEIRAGGKLKWPCEQVRRISILYRDKFDRPRIRMSFDNISTIHGLNEAKAVRARRALQRVTEIALHIGRDDGHVLLKSEALLIPNDSVLHGRDTYESDRFERLLFRSYVVTEEAVRAHHGNTMLSLRL